MNVPTWAGVGVSVVLVVVAVAVAVRARLGLERDLILAGVRAGAQLIAVALILGVIFTRGGVAAAVGWVVVMVVIGGSVAAYRGRGLPRARATATLAVAIGGAGVLGALLAMRVIDTEPRVIVPVGGMIITGAMQATALTLIRVRDDAAGSRAAIEARLCLGLPATEAFAPYARSAVRTALLPSIDATKVVGLISLPGAMTGLILAGVDPLDAIRYQIVVMYMLLAAGSIAAFTAARLAQRSLFDDAHRMAS